MPDIKGFISKLTNNADKIGMIAGALAFGIDPLLDDIQRIPQAHIPDIKQVIDELFRGEMGNKMKVGIMGYIGGLILSEVGFSQGRWIQRGSEGYLKGLAIQHVAYYSTHSPPGHQRDYESASNSNISYDPRMSYGGN